MMDNRERIDSYFRFVQILFKYALFVLLAFLIRGLIQFGAGELAGEGAYEALALEWMALAGALLAYFTLTRSFTVYDMTYRDRFFEGEKSRLSFLEKGKFIFCTPKFWIELLVTYALVAIMPYRFGFFSLINVLSFYAPVQVSQAKLYIILIAFPILFLFTLLAYFSTLNWWILQYQKEKKKEKKRGGLFKALAVAFFAYCGGALMMPIALSIFISILNILGSTTVVIFLVILGVALLALCYTGAVLKRKKLLRELKKICDEKGFRLSKIKAGYWSIFRVSRGSSFTVLCGEHTYECKLISGVRKGSPMFLDSSGNGKVVHTFYAGRVELFHFVTFFQYGFETQHKKIVIINPIPKAVFKAEAGRAMAIDTGEIIGGYHIYNATGFLGALERDCLGK